MIKNINHQNFLTTPFAAIKQWELYNVQNDDVVLIEPPDSPEIPVALDYVDYGGSSPILNRACNIALEQQDSNEVIYQEGISGSGFFFPDDAQNQDGTYKRIVWDQTWRSFYNLYRDPTKMFGMDHIDFPLGKTDRQFSEFIRLFNIPQRFWGDRLVPKSIQLYDTSLDDNVEVYDDGYQNLFAGTNLFSKVQEIRLLGNIIIDGNVTNSCEVYDDTHVDGAASSTCSIDIGFASGSLTDLVFTDSASISVGFSGGSTAAIPLSDSLGRGASAGANVGTGVEVGYIFGSLAYRTEYDFVPSMSIGFSSGVLFETTIAVTGSDSASVSLTFDSGSVFNQIVWASGSDSGSVSLTFDSGSIFNQILATSGSDSGSITMSFDSGVLFNDAVPGSAPIAYQTMSIGILSVSRSIVTAGTGYATGSGGIIVPE